jgi:hypothetical protein
MEHPRRSVGLGLGVLGGVVLGGTAAAQPELYLKGALSVAGVQDDNLFSAPDSRQADVITRFTPGIEAGLRSDSHSLEGRFAIDAERFARHPELDSARARQVASLDWRSRATRRVTFSLHGDDLSTLTPGELNLTTGLAAGRRRATRRSAVPAVAWKIGRAAAGSASYTLTKDDLAGGVAATTHTAALGLERRLSPRDTGSLGWDRRVGPHSGFTLRAGPRHSDGRVDPEVSVALHHDAQKLHALLTLSRSLATVIGRAGTVVTDSVLPAVSWRATRFLQWSASPGLFKIRDASGGSDVSVYLLGLEATCRLGDWLSLVGTYRRSLQRGALDVEPGGGAAEPIARDTMTLSLVARQREMRPPASYGSGPGVTP